MLATALYIDTEKDNALSTQNLEVDDTNDADKDVKSAEDWVEIDSEEVDSTSVSKRSTRNTTDLVRLYLQEIGRVPLLRKDEEVSKAQQIQRHIQLIEIRNEAADIADPVIKPFVEVLEVHDRLMSQLSHRPSIKRWARTVGLEITQLKDTLSAGKKRWAEVAQISVKELEVIEKTGVRAKEHMIKANLRLVVSVAKKYQNRGLELLDLIQEGTLGLERAVEKFDPTKGYRFSTYAYWWIRQGITRAIATQSRTIRLPVHITEKLNKIKKAQRKISQEKGCTPSIDEIAKELDMSSSQVRDVLVRVPRSVSLELKVGKDKDTELGDLLETQSASPEDNLMREALHRDLLNLLDDLTSRERDVIQMRFGLKDGKPYSLAEIGRALELSRERVRQIESKALQKLRQPKRLNLVRDYLESLE
ncbi:MAG: RNA polymerase sigma factor SigC [Prochloraceae cyanobacterium]|nr:RNA polymerase sigma factor SigC [Prochloraceae cyanobacterium]